MRNIVIILVGLLTSLASFSTLAFNITIRNNTNYSIIAYMNDVSPGTVERIFTDNSRTVTSNRETEVQISYAQPYSCSNQAYNINDNCAKVKTIPERFTCHISSTRTILVTGACSSPRAEYNACGSGSHLAVSPWPAS